METRAKVEGEDPNKEDGPLTQEKSATQECCEGAVSPESPPSSDGRRRVEG